MVDYARFYNPMDGYFEGQQLGQQTRMNRVNIDAAETRNKAVEDARQNQMLLQAMQIGRHDPKRWDQMMQQLAAEGNKDAEGMIGQWTPLGARRLIDAYSRASGKQSVETGPDGSVAGPAPRAKGEPPQYDQRVLSAIEQMPQEERQKKARQYDFVLQSMEGVRSAEDAHMMLDSFRERGVVDDETAEGFKAVIDGSERGWKAFDNYQNKIAELRDYLDAYTVPGGIEPAKPPPEIMAPEFDKDTGQARWFERDRMTGAMNPRYGGGLPGVNPAAPKPLKPKEIIEIEQSSRKEFEGRVATLIDSKRKLNDILSLSPTEATGIDKVAAVYNMVSGLDPGTAVKEGEIALINSAASMKERLMGIFSQASQGGSLTPKMLEEMQATSRRLLNTMQDLYTMRYNAQIESYSRWVPLGIELRSAVPDLWGARVKGPSTTPKASPKGPPNPKTLQSDDEAVSGGSAYQGNF